MEVTIGMATINREDLLKLGFEETDGGGVNTPFDYVVLKHYIHKHKPWIGLEEHYSKKYGEEIDPAHILSTIVNYGTKKGKIVYSKEDIHAFLSHEGVVPFQSS